jgi:hypothetical protein
MTNIKSAMRKAVLLGALAFAGFSQGGCKDVQKFLVELGNLFQCECLCECAEGYRGGGDGTFDGGGVSFRCISKGGLSDCGNACLFQGATTAAGGNLLACFSV